MNTQSLSVCASLCAEKQATEVYKAWEEEEPGLKQVKWASQVET